MDVGEKGGDEGSLYALGESQEHVRPQFLISKCRLWEWFVESKTMVNTGDFLKLTWY